MNPLITAIIGSWVRAALVAVSAALIQHHVVTSAQGESLVGMLFTQTMNALPGLVALAWSYWQKRAARVKFLTALMPGPKTENEVLAHIDSHLPTPALDTPPNTVPGVPAKA
jgi:hypothetical protein